jgi:NAD(P)-dependent dehydrogenase (short-subunit alcohol dehydrogenase family)
MEPRRRRSIVPFMPTAIVTGASRGIGLAVARELLRDHRVVAAVRKPGDVELRGARVEKLDVSDPDSIATFAARIEGPIDVLVNNAAISRGDPHVIWNTNLRGPALLTRALREKLAPGARVVMVSSGMGTLDSQPESLVRRLKDPALTVADLLRLADDAPGGYGPTKAALNALTRLLARELPTARVNSVCPGWVRTDMGGAGAPRSIDEGAASVLWACRLPPDGPTGGFFRDGHAIAL